MSVELTIGQWAVWDDASYFGDPRYVTAKVVKVTEKTMIHTGLYRGGETRRNRGDEVWCGPEAEARAIVERLNSSVGLMKDEMRRSRERHAERAAKIALRTPTHQTGEAS